MGGSVTAASSAVSQKLCAQKWTFRILLKNVTVNSLAGDTEIRNAKLEIRNNAKTTMPKI